MHIHAELRALRGDIASQRKAREALESARDAWRADAPVASIVAELGEWGDGADLEDCPALAALVADPVVASQIVAMLVAGQLAVLNQFPLGQIPFRHQLAEGLAIVQLASVGRATLALIAYEDSALLGAETAICFSDGERYEIVLAGEADAEIMTIAADDGSAVTFERESRDLAPGCVLHLSGADHAKRLAAIRRTLVVLRLSRTPEKPLPTRQFDLASGKLLHRASGDRRESRHELAMALLGRMGRHDAAPVLAAMTREGSDHLRWQALRECLALDTAAGFAALSILAGDPADSLSATAGALHAQLVETHPQLAALKKDQPCLA